MAPLALAAALCLGLPFWFGGFWLLHRRRQAAQARRQRLLVRIGAAGDAPIEAAGPARQSLAHAIELRLQQAGLTAQGERWLLLAGGVAGLIGIVSVALGTGVGLPAGLTAAALASLAPLYVVSRIVVRRRRFAAQFPNALEAMVRSLQAGHSIDSAMRMVAEEFGSPLADEFGRLNRHVKLGVPLSFALRELQARVGIPEAHFFAATVIVQRESGGQLADVLAQLARIMRRRALFQGKLRALTAESRFTAWFIGGSPLLYLVYKYLSDRQAVVFFLEDPAGRSLLQMALVLIAIGWLLLRQMMRIRF